MTAQSNAINQHQVMNNCLMGLHNVIQGQGQTLSFRVVALLPVYNYEALYGVSHVLVVLLNVHFLLL